MSKLSSSFGGSVVAIAYMVTAVALILFNKSVFAVYDLRAPNVLTVMQCVVSLLMLMVLGPNGLQFIALKPLSIKNSRRLVLLNLSFVLYMVLGMIAMKSLNIPMYTTLRRLTVAIVMILEYLISGKRPTSIVSVSVSIICIGTLIAGWRDLQFDAFAYIVILCYNFFTAIYLILINRISNVDNRERFTSWDFMFYNSLVTIVCIVPLIAYTGELKLLLLSPYLHSSRFQISLFSSSVLAFVLNYTIFLNTRINSALTQTISGQVKDIAVVVLGFALFNDSIIDPLNLTGIFISFAGSILYAASKI